MSTRTITYRVCDGCHLNELDDDIDIVKSKNKYDYHESPTIHLCADCEAKGMYICNLCKEVHDDWHPCDSMIIQWGLEHAN